MNAQPVKPLSKALQLIANKPLRYKSVRDIVIDLQISEKQLRRVCKASFGKTPKRYLQQIKMAYAKEMLLNNVPLEKIYKTSGYSSKDTFTTAFSKYFSVSPTKIKKLLKVNYGAVDMDTLFHFLESLHPVSPSLRDYLLRILKHHFYPKESQLLKETYSGNRVWFVLSGLVRWYYIDENDAKQKTTWFTREGDVILDPSSFYLQLPSTVTIEALEDCETIYAELKDVLKLYEQFPETLHMGRKIADAYGGAVALHSQALLKSNGEARFDYLQNHYSYLMGKVSFEHLASFINISVSSLYRLRKEWVRKHKH